MRGACSPEGNGADSSSGLLDSFAHEDYYEFGLHMLEFGAY